MTHSHIKTKRKNAGFKKSVAELLVLLQSKLYLMLNLGAKLN